VGVLPGGGALSGDHAELPAAARVRKLEDQVIAAGLTTDAELDEILAGRYWTGSPVNGARLVARAWSDAGFMERLLADGNAAAAELGFGASGGAGYGYRLKAVDNTPQRHNVIVCTLCSCYPTSLLGPSPSWYKSFAYRSRTVREPRAVLAEFGLDLPAGTEILVWDSSAETRYLVVPARPADSAGLDEDALARLVTRNGMIGTAAV
jgi:nitrile hydratase subunit alpha